MSGLTAMFMLSETDLLGQCGVPTKDCTIKTLNPETHADRKLNASSLASFYYQLGLTGNRTNLSEIVNGTGRTNQWAYDWLYRLTNEVLVAASGGGTNSYTLNAV